MLKKLLDRFRKPEDPKVVAEKERARREARQAAIRAEADAARHRNYGGLPQMLGKLFRRKRSAGDPKAVDERNRRAAELEQVRRRAELDRRRQQSEIESIVPPGVSGPG